ncbi:MAG: putative toxin-antitoxin system toxin component, PIN family [Marinilabiliaceae bacterium]|jgi:putative PIN family toxin of toxin-antitoxin system|nr:putative toxin-antitoxin system toxin component, PIN family [Marinilabiliaceae bacterium]
MRILIDTNVLISAFVFGGKAGKLFELLFAGDYELFVSEYVDAEFKAILQQKWPQKADVVYSLYRTLPFIFCESSPKQQGELRDRKDIPVLSDALFHGADIVLSGDKDFLEAELETPQVFSPSMLYDFLSNR